MRHLLAPLWGLEICSFHKENVLNVELKCHRILVALPSGSERSITSFSQLVLCKYLCREIARIKPAERENKTLIFFFGLKKIGLTLSHRVISKAYTFASTVPVFLLYSSYNSARFSRKVTSQILWGLVRSKQYGLSVAIVRPLQQRRPAGTIG